MATSNAINDELQSGDGDLQISKMATTFKIPKFWRKEKKEQLTVRSTKFLHVFLTTMKVRELPVELQEIAKKELNEDVDKIQDSLSLLRAWLKFQKHLKYKDDDQFLLAFLRGCKFRIETVKKKLDCYYTSRTLAPEFFTNRSPYSELVQTVLKNNIVAYYSPKLTLPTVCYCAWSHIEKIGIPLNEMMTHDFMAIDVLLNEQDSFIINGVISILDLKDVSLKYILQCHIPTIKKYLFITQNAFPVRVKEVHIINAPPIVYSIYKMCEVVISEKNKKRIRIYSTEKTHQLTDAMSKVMLPNEFGGEAGSITELTNAWRQRIERYTDWFKEENKYKSIEELRAGQAKTHSDFFGLEGSFRQLSFD
ncbi:hypothetical protein RN001_007978 [Aquatica leii]|uniref:CRAL-TRIO domain-containing protein n=1 Tax=Aquatica leii TaxID=1421715 RepID=A0AAN7PYQ3_9COLE|nr:hypothetical protein RN001_007978 [Aquatica leii]